MDVPARAIDALLVLHRQRVLEVVCDLTGHDYDVLAAAVERELEGKDEAE